MSTSVRIVDHGRRPQLEGHRLSVLDVFYYLHRGHDFDFIRRALPSLTREQFDAVVAYAGEHRAELAEEDRRVEEWIRQGIAEQKAKGLYREIDESAPPRSAQRGPRQECGSASKSKRGSDHGR